MMQHSSCINSASDFHHVDGFTTWNIALAMNRSLSLTYTHMHKLPYTVKHCCSTSMHMAFFTLCIFAHVEV